MKRYFLFYIILILASCQKDNSEQVKNNQTVIGKHQTKDSLPLIDEITSDAKVAPLKVEFDLDTYLESPSELKTIFTRVDSLNSSDKKTEDEFYGELNCMRNIPVSLLKTDGLSFHKFVLNDSLKVGEEIAIIDGQDSLYLVNKGCEYYWVEYWYSTKKEEDINLNDGFIRVLKNIERFDTSPFNFGEWIDYVKAKSDSNQVIDMKKEYFIEESFISRYFEVSSIEEFNDRAIYRFNYTVGPL